MKQCHKTITHYCLENATHTPGYILTRDCRTWQTGTSNPSTRNLLIALLLLGSTVGAKLPATSKLSSDLYKWWSPTGDPASNGEGDGRATASWMVEVTGALEEVSADTITAVLGVTMEGPINPTLGVVVSGGRWTLSSTKTCLLRSQLQSPLTVSSDFWFPSTTFLPDPPPPQKAAVLVFKVPIGTARSTNRKNSLWHSNPTGYILSYRKNKREPTKRKSQGKTNHPVPQLGCTWKSLSQWAWLTSIESPAGANHHYS